MNINDNRRELLKGLREWVTEHPIGNVWEFGDKIGNREFFLELFDRVERDGEYTTRDRNWLIAITNRWKQSV